MILRYTVTRDDYYHYCVYSYDHNELVAKQVLRVRVWFSGMLLLFSIAVFVFPITSHPIAYVAVLWGIGAIFIANTKRSIRKANKKQYRTQIEAGKGAEFIGEYTLELGEQSITLSQPLSTAETAYTAIKGIGQDAYCLYVFCGSLSAILLPLSAFQDEKQKAALLGLLESKCGPLAMTGLMGQSE